MVNGAEAEKECAKVFSLMRFNVQTGCIELPGHFIDVNATLERLFSMSVFEDGFDEISVVDE